MMQGLSEPLGALMALLLIKPFLTPMRLQYMLAFVGGVMVKHAFHTCCLTVCNSVNAFMALLCC